MKSYFDGTLIELICWKLLGCLLTVCTLGICYPWAVCMVYGWEINHTVINGRRIKFTGSASGLFGLWLKWLVLCIITCGIYSFGCAFQSESGKQSIQHFKISLPPSEMGADFFLKTFAKT